MNHDFTMLNHIPHLVIVDQNEEMTRLPSEEEVKGVGFYMNGDSVCVPDDFSKNYF